VEELKLIYRELERIAIAGRDKQKTIKREGSRVKASSRHVIGT
jgi:hypothetical protein